MRLAPLRLRFSACSSLGTRDDLNLYAYTGNDPLNNTDPSGENIVKLILQLIKPKPSSARPPPASPKPSAPKPNRSEPGKPTQETKPPPPKESLELKPGTTQTIDPKKLSTDRQTLESRRLETQKELASKGENVGNVKVDKTGNIFDGNHRARAASDAGRNVDVDVIDVPNAKPGARGVDDLPIVDQ